MGAQLLPLFPLSLVLLPGMMLPLHIFETRYREMMADVLPEGHEFGIVFAKENGIVNIGCTATVHRVLRRYEDGRLDILVRGGRRFEIGSLDEGKSYLRAEIRYFDDEDEEVPSQELRSKALQILEKLRAIEETGVAIEPNPESSRLSFQVAQFI